MGRKPLKDARNIKITVRFNDKEKAILDHGFEESYVGCNNISEFIRYLTLKSDELITKTKETKEKQEGAVINKEHNNKGEEINGII